MEGREGGKRERVKGGNSCYKNPIFCITPTNFVVIYYITANTFTNENAGCTSSLHENFLFVGTPEVCIRL